MELDDFLPDDHVLFLPSPQSITIASQIAKRFVERECTTGLFSANLDKLDIKALKDKAYSIFVTAYTDSLKQDILDILKEELVGLLLTTDEKYNLELDFDYIFVFADTPKEIKKEVYNKYLNSLYEESIMDTTETLVIKKDGVEYLKL